MRREVPQCDLCGYDRPHDRPHDVVLCEKRELRRRRTQVTELTKSVKDWTNAWYELREVIAALSWDVDEERLERARATLKAGASQ